MATAFANLECGVCTYYYDNKEHKPKILPNCGHVYCQACLLRLTENNKNGEVCCPTCDETQNMAACPNGVVDLPTNRFMLEVLEDFLCMECGELSEKATKKCSQCPLKSCETCKIRHQSAEHCKVLHDLHETKRHACDDVVNRCIDQMCEHDKIDLDALRVKIRNTWHKLRAELDARFTKILEDVDQMENCREKLKNAIATRDFVQEAKCSMDRGVDLATLQTEVTRMKELVTSLKGDFDLGPIHLNLDSAAVSESIEQFGSLITVETATENVDEQCMIDCHNERVVKTRLDGTESGDPFEPLYNVAICPLTGNIYVSEATGYVRIYSGDGEWDLIRRFETNAKMSLLTIDSFGRVILSDYPNSCIHIFSADGELIHKFGSPGAARGQFDHPQHVTTDSDDMIYVADERNERICVHRNDGTFVCTIGQNVLKAPYGLVVSDKKQIIVTDTDLNEILIFSIDDGHLVDRISKVGDRNSMKPGALCKDKNGYILVEDVGDSETLPFIEIFTGDMTYHGRVAIPGLVAKNVIEGVAVAANGDIIIANYSGREILVI